MAKTWGKKLRLKHDENFVDELEGWERGFRMRVPTREEIVSGM